MPVNRGLSSLQRTIKYLKDQGYIVEKVEQSWNQYTRKRHDAFGILDAIALGEGHIIGIQACSGSDFSEHHIRILEAENTVDWLVNGGILRLIGWRKLKVKRGGKAMRWVPKVREYYLGGDGIEWREL